MFFRPLRACLIFALYILPSWSLHESEAGVIDWHKLQVGIPLTGSPSTAPVFHRIASKKSTQSVVLTATSSNVLAALNPVDGSVAWRHIFEPEDHIAIFRRHQDVVATLSGSGGSVLRIFDALHGYLLVEKHLHHPRAGRLTKPDDFGTAISFLQEDGKNTADVFVLTNGHTLRRVDGQSGELKWSWTAPDETSLVLHSKVITTPSTTYMIGLAKGIASYTLHITALSTSTGEVISSSNIPSSISGGPADLFALTQGANVRLLWIEQGAIKHFVLSPSLRGTPVILKGAVYKQIIDVGLSEHGQVVVLKADGSGCIVKTTDDGAALGVTWEFAESASSDRYSESHYAGGFDKDGHPYIARVYWSYHLKVAAVHIYCAHHADGRGFVTGFTFPFQTNEHGIISHVAIDTANPEGYTILARLFLTTTTGAVQLWQQDKHQWTREESLASISVAELVELPERKVAASHIGDENFFNRVTRQLSDAQDFPQYLLHFIQRFATGSYASVSSSAVPRSDAKGISRDTFGFRQIIVAATPYGKVYGIDSSNGRIIWSRVLGLGWAAQVGGKVLPVKLFVTRSVSDGDTPQVVLVTQRRADNSLVDTVLFHIDVLTGHDVRKVSPPDEVFQGLDIIQGPLVEAYLLQNDNKTIVFLDEYLQTSIYPDEPENKAAFTKAVPSLHFALRTGSRGEKRLSGHQLTLRLALADRYIAYPTWTASLPPTEDIISITPSERGPVASIGKVLGNRTTLYKYLNPHLSAVLTASGSVSAPTCSIYLLDVTKGSQIYHVTLPSNRGVCDVKVALTENWLVYHYYDDDFAGVATTKGYRMVSVELFEGTGVDDKTKSSDMSSFSDKAVAITAHEQSYIFQHAVTAISTTSTKFGVTTKDIIVATHDNKIHGIPRRFLDPRRPHRKTTPEETEEFLLQYDPAIPIDPRRILSHNYEVANIRRIVTSPALLESTSLVFAHGLDLFLTRVAPSRTFDVLNENFNKVQLVLTISGLAIAIMITKPMVRRKRLQERWYQ